MGAAACSSSQPSGKRTGASTGGEGAGAIGGTVAVLGGGKVTGALARVSSVLNYDRRVARREKRPAEGG